jgi:hypothetical protein
MASQETWAVSHRGCNLTAQPSDNCPELRGGLFDLNASSTWISTSSIWKNKGFYKLETDISRNLGISGVSYKSLKRLILTSFSEASSDSILWDYQPTVQTSITLSWQVTSLKIIMLANLDSPLGQQISHPKIITLQHSMIP